VIGAESTLTHRPSLGGIGIDVVEVLETGRIFEIAEQRQPVPPVPLRCVFLRGRLGGDQDWGDDHDGDCASAQQEFGAQSTLLPSIETAPILAAEPNRSGPLLWFWNAAPACCKASNGRWGSNSRAIPENPAAGRAKSLAVAQKNCAELAGDFARGAALLFGDRQWLRAVGEGIEIGDCVSPLAG